MVLRHLQYYVKVVECRSFSVAAEQLFISQSAVSQQISALEAELGVLLLKREKRSFRLTPAGDYFYRRCKSILAQLETAMAETQRIGNDGRVQLRVGCLNLYGGYELRDAVIAFTERYPAVEVTVVSGNHDELYRRVLSRELDMVLNDQRRAFSDEFENFELVTSYVMVDVPASFPLRREDRAELDELAVLPCILISSRGGYAADEAFYREIVGISDNFIYAETAEEARLLAAARRGFLPMEGAGAILPAPKGIRRVMLCRNGNPLRHRFCAFWLKECSGFYIEEFAALVRELLQAAQREPLRPKYF